MISLNRHYGMRSAQSAHLPPDGEKRFEQLADKIHKLRVSREGSESSKGHRLTVSFDTRDIRDIRVSGRNDDAVGSSCQGTTLGVSTGICQTSAGCVAATCLFDLSHC